MAEEVKKKEEAKPEVQMVSFTIDGQQVSFPKGTTVLEAAKELGIHIPTFCWHPKLKSVGSCRMCYVEIEKWPKLAVSCATEIMPDMVVYTNSDKVKQGRKAILEFILANHPLDCPTCDKGGECDLQNLTFAHGIDDSRFDFQKNRFTSGTDGTTFDDKRIGPEIYLNRNRCILCYKCVRANKEAFGEYDIGVYERGNIAEINSAPNRQVANPFSGNLVQICPVGALTSSDWRYKIRVWLTKTTPSICNFSSSGANILFFKDENKNKLHRVIARCNDDIDDGWIPDITRYGYQIINSEERLKTPLIKKEGKQVEATWDEALDVIAKKFNEIIEKKGRVCLGGLAAPHIDNAGLYSFSKLFRTVLKNNNIDHRSNYRMLPKEVGSHYLALCNGNFRIADIDDSDVIVAFGSDLLKEHHNIYLRIRKAYNFNNSRIFSVNPYSVKSSDVSEAELVYNVGTDEVLVNAIGLAAIEMDLVDKSLGQKFKEKVSPKTLSETSSICGVDEDQIKLLARALASGKKISFICGELFSRSIARDNISSAILNINKLFGIEKKGQLTALARYANSRGADKMAVMPNPPKTVVDKLTELWGEFPEGEPQNTDAMLALMRKEEINGCFIMGMNPVMMYPDRQFVSEGMERLDFLVACDMFETETTEIADVVLPMSSWAEYPGSYINQEDRIQKVPAAIKQLHQSKTPLEIVKCVAEKLDAKLFEDDDQLNNEIEQLLALKKKSNLPDEFCEVKYTQEEIEEDFKIPLFIGDDPHHSGYLTQKSNSLINFKSEAYLDMSPDLAQKLGIGDGESVRVESPVGKIIIPTKISDCLDNDVVFIPRNFSTTQVTSLLMRKKRIDRVKITKVDE